MFVAVLTAALLIPAVAQKPVTFKASDCGTSSTHARFTTCTTDPASPTTGEKITVTCAGSLDEQVTAGQFEAKVTAAGVTLSDKTGSNCEDTTWNVTFLGQVIATVDYFGLKCPLASGSTGLQYAMTLSNSVPPGIGNSIVNITAKDQNGADLLCVNMELDVASTVLAQIPNDEYGQAFNNFETRFKRNYASKQERESGFNNFKAAYIHIARENAKGTNSYELGVNEFSDMTPEDFAATHYGFVSPGQRYGDAKYLGTHKYNGEALPDSVDWRNQGAVTPVKNQQQCGSCWAFSTTGSMEGAWKIAGNQLVSLSEEQLVACSKQNSGCQGGSMDLAFQYEEGTAVCTEQSYPYTSGSGSVGACEASSCTAGIPRGGISGFKDVASNENSLMSAVAQQPVSIAVEADKAVFQNYKSGVMTGACGGNLDHGILAVGYGTENGQDYWLVKNSWGTSWGEAGYGKLERGKGGTGECGILQMDSYPVVSGSHKVLV